MKIETLMVEDRRINATEIKAIDTLSNEKKPFLIEVFGMPNAGKTHAIQRLETILKRNTKLNIRVIYEAAQKCTIKEKFNIDFNLWTACETIKSLLGSIDRQDDIIICERGVIDAINWAHTYFLDSRITKEQFDILTTFYSFDRWFSLLRYVLIFKCDINIVLQREEVLELENIYGSIVNHRVLNLIKESLDFSESYLKKNNIDYSIIDTSKQSQSQTNSSLIVSIIDYLINICKN